MKNILKKIASLAAIVAVFAMPMASQASFLGIATTGDLSSIQAQIDTIQKDIDLIKQEIEEQNRAIIYGKGDVTSDFSPAVLGSQLPSSPALVDTYLASNIGTTDVSMTLAKGTTNDGITLAGYMCFTIDVNTPQLEYVCGSASGTAITGMVRGLGFSNPNTTSSALAFTHRRFASVQSTDYPTLQLIVRQLTGIDSISSTALFYANEPTFTLGTQIIDKTYADNLTFTGSPASTNAVPGLGLTAATAQLTNSVATSTVSSTVYQYFVSAGSVASTSAVSKLVLTNGSGTINPSFISSATSTTYTVGNLISTSSTFKGTSTFAALPYGVMIASGTNPISSIAPSTSGNLLTSNGTTWASSPIAISGIIGNVTTSCSTTVSTDGIIVANGVYDGGGGGSTATFLTMTIAASGQTIGQQAQTRAGTQTISASLPVKKNTSYNVTSTTGGGTFNVSCLFYPIGT